MAEPNLGVDLTIHPDRLELLFWESDVYREAAKRIDVWTLCLTLSNNVLLHVFATKNERFLPHPIARSLQNGAYVMISLVICQLMWERLSMDNYHRWRGVVVLARRVFTLSTYLSALLTIRQVATDGAEAWEVMKSREFWLPPGGSAVRQLLMGSGAVVPLIHGVTAPLPFALQLLLHTIYLAASLVIHAAPTQRMLSIPDLSQEQMCSLCDSMNTLLRLMESVLLTIPQHTTSTPSTCGSQAAPALTVFAHLYCGFVIPLYAAYRLERELKQVFLIRILMDNEGSQAAAVVAARNRLSFPHVADFLVLLLLAPVVWVGSLHLHTLIYDNIVLPLDL